MILYEEECYDGYLWRRFDGEVAYRWRSLERRLLTRQGERVSSNVSPQEARRSLRQLGHKIDNPGGD